MLLELNTNSFRLNVSFQNQIYILSLWFEENALRLKFHWKKKKKCFFWKKKVVNLRAL